MTHIVQYQYKTVEEQESSKEEVENLKNCFKALFKRLVAPMFFVPGYKVTGVMKTFFVFFQKSNIKFDTKNDNSEQVEEEKSNNV